MNDANSDFVTLVPQEDPIREGGAAPVGHPQRIGRYRIEKVLGEGGFGLVFLAHDEQLNRPVAIKVPHARLISKAEDSEAYLAEARTVANLDHPGIVQVHDVGRTENCPCYVVSKYIEGTDLSTKLKQQRLNYREAAELVATVAEALHYAHKQGLVHRDVKPGNILIGKDGKPYVVDFGLALQEENIGKGAKFAGTPAYMSPEQARGEGHRVDGRSDIFSLGVVFYELLAGRPPFRGHTQAELLQQVTRYEAKPLRQYDEKVPKELERICQKAMSKRASERYLSAHDLAEDLRHFLSTAEQIVIQSGVSPGGMATVVSDTHGTTPPTTSVGPIAASAESLGLGFSTNSQPIQVVPKGLRSFDAHDADFFLELLPGPRDREGLPDSLRFWKTRIEETDPDNTFSVGLIYGPSGCGKSSLVKAGLLPRLSDDVIPVYIEATLLETETRLLHGLRKRCPGLAVDQDLQESLAALRRGRCLPAGRKVLIVLDQFEQWLHARKEETNTDLVQALRQCDGGRVQCIVMVRDDFWLAVSRFLRELEVRLVEGHNIALADLFDLDHARKVLAAFGRAFAKLPGNIGATTKEQKDFLKQSVTGLSEEGKVICVRLALFAEMMKGKTWTPAALKDVGGTQGVGVTFLEETFSSAAASPDHRYHQKAARAVLKELLPDSGSDIKGHMRSYAELLEASGYGNRPRDFDDLVRILDTEIRLITPTDPEGKDASDGLQDDVRTIRATPDSSCIPQTFSARYYQLTHDYLVHSLRDWLTRKQKETRKGRAELRLSDLAGTWNARPENRFLPSWWENLNIRMFTDRKKWTEPQRKMMVQAGRFNGIRTSIIAGLLAVATFTGLVIRERVLERQMATESIGLVQRLLDTETAHVPAVVTEMSKYRKWIDPLLLEQNRKADSSARQKLHASLALLTVDSSQVVYLYSRLLDAEPHEVAVIRHALAPYQDDALLDNLWAVVESPEKGKEPQRLRAAAALAEYDPEGEKWAKCSSLVVNDLVLENPVDLGQWSEMYRPVKDSLLEPLAAIFHDRNPERAPERTLATNLLTDYTTERPLVLAELLMDSDQKQFSVTFPKLKEHRDTCSLLLTGEIEKKLPPELPSADDQRETLAKRQANAAVAMLRMNRPEKVWPLLKHSPDPRLRSYLIHQLSLLGADPQTIIKRLDEESDISIRRALLLSLGEFSENALPADSRSALLAKLQTIYRTDADSGLHAAAEWLLRQWGQAEQIQGVVNSLRANEEQLRARPPDQRQWYVNTQGQTFVILDAGEFQMGSQDSEPGRQADETQHRRRLGRTLAIAAKEVTKEEYRRFLTANPDVQRFNIDQYSKSDDSPQLSVDWYDAARYCNWLSQSEGLPEDQWCYDPKKPFAEGMRPAPNFLERKGYRLPTEAEWEFSCRAGAVTSRYYGAHLALLPKYAWHLESSLGTHARPTGVLKPNDFGLFDALGNAIEWCHDAYGEYPVTDAGDAVNDDGDRKPVEDSSSRVLRGAPFDYLASNVRSASRIVYRPGLLSSLIGVRPARTYR